METVQYKIDTFDYQAMGCLDNIQIADLNYALTVLVPTRNEAGNVGPLLERINEALAGLPIEVLFVDDSSDSTPEVVRSYAHKYCCIEVNLIHRTAQERTGGLSGAVVAGMRAAKAPWVCVIDGDLQHPPEIIPQMYALALDNHFDLVLASRRVEGSHIQLSRTRNLISLGLDGIAHGIFPRALHGVSDPLTGFFMVRLDALKLDQFRPQGFKILLETLVRHPDLKKAEVSFSFGERHSGQSKAGILEALRYFNLLFNLRFGDNWARMVAFGLVGLSGIFVNSLAMALFTSLIGIHYLVSAALATVVSSTWNFLLSEYWVFSSGKQSNGRLTRFTLFFLVNSLAMLLRAPMIYGLTSILGMHYLISNLFSLIAMFLVRYMVADRWIWNGQPQAKTSATEIASILPKVSRKDNMTTKYYYNIHDIITVVSDVALPELKAFRVEEEITQPTMKVEIGKPSRELNAERQTKEPGIRHHYYREVFGGLGFEAEINIGQQIEIIAAPLLRHSPHVLYTNLVEPVLRWAFVERGYALVHGATIAYDNRAYMITARTDTGKTTTLLKILNQQRRDTDKASFISDDMTILSRNGNVMTYPKPLTISHHTVKAVNPEVLTTKERLALYFQSRIHSRSGRQVAFFLGRTKLPMATINTLVQWLVPPPKYHVDRLVPRVKFAQSVCLAGLFIIERGVEIENSIDKETALEILFSNCEDAYGFPPYESIKEFLYMSDGNDLRKIEQSIIRSAFDYQPVTLVRSNNMTWWRRIPDYMDQEMARDFSSSPGDRPARQKSGSYERSLELSPEKV